MLLATPWQTEPLSLFVRTPSDAAAATMPVVSAAAEDPQRLLVCREGMLHIAALAPGQTATLSVHLTGTAPGLIDVAALFTSMGGEGSAAQQLVRPPAPCLVLVEPWSALEDVAL